MASVASAAPTRVVHGTIRDQATHEPIDGAIVLGEYTTAISRSDGTFDIKIDPNERDLAITAPGYHLRTVAITVPLAIELVPGAEQIEVAGTAPMQTQTKAQSYQLTDDDIRMLPGTGNDALRAVQALPGVARMPYSFGGLVLRGSSPRDNAVYIDGIEVPIAFHFGGVTSFYPSGMLSNLTLTAGGFDAEYGRAQGGIVTLTTREPRTDKWRTGGSIGLLDSAVYAEGPVADGGVLIGIRRSYFDIVAIAFAPDDVPLPSYWDGQIRGSFGDPEHGGRWSPMLFFAFDNVSITSAGQDGHEDETSMSSLFVRAALPYLRQWGPLTLHVVPWIGVNELSFKSITNGVAETFDRPTYPGGARADITREMPWGQLRGGVDSEGGYLSHSQSGLGQPGDILQQMNGTTTETWLDAALWGEAQFRIGDRVALKPSVRVDRYGLSDEIVADPRLALHERLTDSLTLRETVGRYHQPPTAGDVDPNGGNPDLKSSFVDQAAVGVDGDLDNGWSGSITGFYSYGQNIGVRTTSDAGDFSDLGALGPTFELLLEKQLGLAFERENLGRSKDDGIELLIRRQTPRWFGMISYTLSQAQRTDDPYLYTYGWRPFELDQTHNLNLVGSVKVGTWRLGARLQLVSGDPYTPTPPAGTTVPPVASAEPYTANLPWFIQLDLRADRRWHRCWGDINLYIDIQNATNRSNVEGREFGYDTDHPFGYDKDIPGLPIAPFIGVEFLPK